MNLDGKQTGGIKAQALRCALVIATKDLDGFLAKVLPSGGVRVPFNFGVGFSNERRFFTEGGIDWPTEHAGPSIPDEPPARGLLAQPDGNGNRQASMPGAPTAAASALQTIPNLSSTNKPELGVHQIIAIDKGLGPIKLGHLFLGLAPAPDSANAQANAEVSLSLTVELGPLTATVDRIGFEVGLAFPESGGNVGFADFSMGFKPPTGVGIKVESSVITGGGYLFFDPKKAEYGGILQLEVAETIAVKAIGLLTTRLPDGSKGYLRNPAKADT
jgi:hypothetical protein